MSATVEILDYLHKRVIETGSSYRYLLKKQKEGFSTLGGLPEAKAKYEEAKANWLEALFIAEDHNRIELNKMVQFQGWVDKRETEAQEG